MPHPINTTPKRLGKAVVAPVSANASNDSSHGNAMVQPIPRRTVRRENRGEDFLSAISSPFGLRRERLLHVRISSIQELLAGDDGFDQRTETVVLCRKARLHAIDDGLVGDL